MKQPSMNILIAKLRICIAALILVILSLAFFSFTIQKMNDDFLKQLGILKPDADEKISSSMLGGYIDAYGVKNIKNIALGKRSAVAKDLLNYTKQYVSSPAFKKEYEAMKERNKPSLEPTPQTPEEMRASMIKLAKEFIVLSEGYLKTATPATKKIYEDNLESAKKSLQTAEDPNNKNIKAYTQNYAKLVKFFEESNQAQLKKWESDYPSNYMSFIKPRLEQFLEETKDIDFSAELTEKAGYKIFVNKDYERKSNRWKMAFRAGKEVVEPARAFVQQWIAEIK